LPRLLTGPWVIQNRRRENKTVAEKKKKGKCAPKKSLKGSKKLDETKLMLRHHPAKW
jgi:hypothetical protein